MCVFPYREASGDYSRLRTIQQKESPGGQADSETRQNPAELTSGACGCLHYRIHPQRN
jgi:hypothetical protein